MGFVARRQRMYPYVILLASRPQPLGPPSTRNYGWNRALASGQNPCAKKYEFIFAQSLRKRVRLMGLAIATVAIAGCSKTPLRPQSALRSPSSYNDGTAMLFHAPAPHPLLVVSLPNTPNGKPHVDTVLSVLAPHAAATAAPPPPPIPISTTMQVHEEILPATRPASAPATAPAATESGRGPIRAGVSRAGVGRAGEQ